MISAFFRGDKPKKNVLWLSQTPFAHPNVDFYLSHRIGALLHHRPQDPCRKIASDTDFTSKLGRFGKRKVHGYPFLKAALLFYSGMSPYKYIYIYIYIYMWEKIIRRKRTMKTAFESGSLQTISKDYSWLAQECRVWHYPVFNFCGRGAGAD